MAVALSLASSIWAKVPDMVLCIVSIMVRVLCMVAIIWRELGEQLRQDRIQLIEVLDEILHLIVDLVDTVDCIEYGSERLADGNIEAVLFPVKVIADRPKEIVEIRNVIPHFCRDFLQFMG